MVDEHHFEKQLYRSQYLLDHKNYYTSALNIKLYLNTKFDSKLMS